MSYTTRFFVAASLAIGLATAGLPSPASAAFTDAQLGCRKEIGKSGTKYVKTAIKSMTKCHKSQDKDGGAINCNNIAATDPDNKVPATADKIEAKVVDKCTGITPTEVLYDGCPIPCHGAVPTVTTFANVVDCIVCLSNSDTQSYSDEANGSPTVPLTNEADLDCHSSIVKNSSKLYNSAVKSATKCQASYDELNDLSTCTGSGFAALTSDAYDKCHEAVQGDCTAATLPGTTLDACGGSATASALATCVCTAALTDAQTNAQQIVDLSGPVATTTTTTTTTTSTTLIVGDVQCPDVGELVLYSHDSQVACTSNTDCTLPRTCNTSIGYCTSVADLDSGWTGNAHNSDINDAVATRAYLYCPGPTPACGECDVLGIDPSPGNCRCENNSRTICDNPFASSASECPACVGGSAVDGNTCTSNTDCNFPICAGRCSGNSAFTCATNADCKTPVTPANYGNCSTSTAPSFKKKCANGVFCDANADCVGTCSGQSGCECFFGAPFPLNSAGTAVCIVNRFANNISGTANVDLGAGDITANLRTRVYLGTTQAKPCPVCGGKCSQSPTKTCANNSDCVTPAPGGTCGSYDTPNDGLRNGTCSGGINTGLSCDATANNATFPARTSGGVPQLPGGGLYSLDCMPSDGANVSGTGLQIDLEQTTGTTSLTATLDCDGAGAGTDQCPCMQCSKDKTIPCSDDLQCAGQGRFCSAYNDPVTFNCTTNDDCASVDTGTCTLLSNTKCSNASTRSCTTNADCGLQLGGICTLSSCSSPGIGEVPKPNKCTGGLCEDVGDGFNGRCTVGPDQGYCDGLLRIDGTGMNACASDSDCTNGDHCTLSQRQLCFLDPIVATGDPDPSFPVAGSVFCVPPTEYSTINTVAGLPGPGRVISQGAATTFCHNDHNVQYTPGGSPACP